jgi:hypothetical protein
MSARARPAGERVWELLQYPICETLARVTITVMVSLLAISCSAVLAVLALTWNVMSWRRNGPRVSLETFFGMFHPQEELARDAVDTHFQIVRVTNSGRMPADIVLYGLRFYAPRRGLVGRLFRVKIVEYGGSLDAPPQLPVRIQPFTNIYLHPWEIGRFIKFAETVSAGITGCKFQFYVHISGQREVATKLQDVSTMLSRWDGRNRPGGLSLKTKLRLAWIELVLRLKRRRAGVSLPG